jgi:TonB family protein
MLELKPTPTVGKSQTRSGSARSASTRSTFDDPQPRRLLLALVLLLVALAAVVVKDRDFWFGTEVAALDSDGTEPAVASRAPESKADSKPAKSIPTAGGVKPAKSAALATRKQISAAKPSTEAVSNPTEAPAVTTVRTVLPPLEVEVIAGDHHHTLRPGSNATKVELTRPGQPAAGFSSINSAPINAAEREQIADASQRPAYPLLAQHMNVQGSVVLQAVIGADGIIQDLHVLSGPAILAAAAQQAVREWHFKPVLQNGSPVDTQAKITVNFTIKIADGTGPTFAESRYDGIQILSR